MAGGGKMSPEVLEAAVEEWVQMGYPREEFTVEKIAAIWSQQEEQRIQENIIGTNLLKEKAELIRLQNENSLLAPVRKKWQKGKKQLNDGFKRVISEAGGKLEPSFVKHYRREQEHKRKVIQQIKDAQRIRMEKLEFQRKRRKHKLQEKLAKVERDKKLKANQELREFERATEMRIARELRQAKLEEMHALRREAHNHSLAVANEEARRQAKLQARKRFQHREREAARWNRYQLMSRNDGNRLAKALHEKNQQQSEKFLKFKQNEPFQTSEMHRVDEEGLVEVTNSANNHRGVFGTPIGPGELVDNHDGLPLHARDNIEAGDVPSNFMSDSHGVDYSYTHLERDLVAANTRRKQVRGQVDKLLVSAKQVDGEIQLLQQQRQFSIASIKAIDTGEGIHEHQLAGPPRRDANESDQLKTHHTKTRKWKLQSEIVRIDNQLDILQKRAQDHRSHAKRLEKQLTEMDQVEEQLVEQMKEFVNEDTTGANLPVVRGQALHKVEGIRENVGTNPTMKLSQTMLQSKVELLKHAGDQLEDSRAHLKKSLHNQWKMREEEIVLRGDLQKSKTQLAMTEDRLKRMVQDNLKNDLVAAITKFWAQGGMENLKPFLKDTKGHLDWWTHRSVDACSNIQLFGRQGVRQGDSKTATCQGVVMLPRYALWHLKFHITRKSDMENIGDPRDSVTVHLGPSTHTTGLVGKYHNSRSPGEFSVRHEINFVIHSSAVAYRFEYASSTCSPDYHLFVQRGRFTEEQFPDLEIIDPDRNLVLSEYVRRARLNAQQPTTKLATYVAEYIEAEEQKEVEFWDSTLIQGCMQRFPRKAFLELLKIQIDREVYQIEQEKQDKKDNKAALLQRLENNQPQFTIPKRLQSRGVRLPVEEDTVSRNDGALSSMTEWPPKVSDGSNPPHSSSQGTNVPTKSRSSRMDSQELQMPSTKPSTPQKTPKTIQNKRRVPGSRESTRERISSRGTESPRTSDAEQRKSDGKIKTMIASRRSVRGLTPDSFPSSHSPTSTPSTRPMTTDEQAAAMKEKHIQDAIMRYMDRKRKGPTVSLEDAGQLVGHKVEVYYPDQRKWRFGTVEEFKLEVEESDAPEDARSVVLHRVVFQGDIGSSNYNNVNSEGSTGHCTMDESNEIMKGDSVEASDGSRTHSHDTIGQKLGQVAGEWLDLQLWKYVVVKIDSSGVEAKRKEIEARHLELVASEIAAQQEREAEFQRTEDEIRAEEDAENRILLDKHLEEVAIATKEAQEEAERIIEEDDKEVLRRTRVIMGAPFVGDPAGDAWDLKVTPDKDESMVQAMEELIAEKVKSRVVALQHVFRREMEKREAASEAARQRRMRISQQRLKRDAKKKHQETLVRMVERHTQLRKDIGLIEQFDQCIPHVFRCEHRNHKYWGTLYQHGIRCTDCNMELSKSHEADPLQMLESNAQIGLKVREHRLLRGHVRFGSSEDEVMVLSERQRVEKEEWMIAQNTGHFYDRKHEKEIERFNKRHHLEGNESHGSSLSNTEKEKSARDEGILSRKEPVRRNNSRNQRSSQTHLKSNHQNNQIVDAEAEENGPGHEEEDPRKYFANVLREDLTKRIAFRHDFVQMCWRIRNAKVKHRDLSKRVEDTSKEIERTKYRLEQGHRDETRVSQRLVQVEAEHERCESMVKVRSDALKAEKRAQKELQKALFERGKYEAQEDALRENMLLCAAELKLVTSKLEETAPWNEMARNLKDHALDVEQEARTSVALWEEKLEIAKQQLRLQQWKREGFLVHMPEWCRLGNARIAFFRDGKEDSSAVDMEAMRIRMAVVAVSFGSRIQRATTNHDAAATIVKMYIPVQQLMDAETSRESCELETMIREERTQRKALKIEHATERNELSLMKSEEEYLRVVYNQIDSERFEKEAILTARAEAKRGAQFILSQPWKKKDLMAKALGIAASERTGTSIMGIRINGYPMNPSADTVAINSKNKAAGRSLAKKNSEGSKNFSHKKDDDGKVSTGNGDVVRSRWPTHRPLTTTEKALMYAERATVWFTAKRKTASLGKRFVQEQMDLAELEVKERYAKLKRVTEQEDILQGVVDELVQEALIDDVAREELEHTYSSCKRKMVDLNLYFPIKGKVPYHVYNDLAKVWHREKSRLLILRDHVQRYINAQREEEEERERARKEIENRGVAVREEGMDDWEYFEQTRIAIELIEMEEQERWLRKFYKEERRLFLIERWAMAAEEQIVREVLKQEALESIKSKYDINGDDEDAPPVKSPKKLSKSKKKKRREQLKKQVAERQRAAREQKGMALEDTIGYEMRQEDARARQKALLELELGGGSGDDNDDGEREGEDAATRIERLRIQREAAQARERVRQQKLRAEQQWERETTMIFAQTIACELEIMESKEKLWQAMQQTHRAELTLLKVDIRVKDIVSSHITQEKKMQEFTKSAAIARKRSLKAIERVEKARPVLKRATKERARILKETVYMDSRVMHVSGQRFDTDKLLKELHRLYFFLIMSRIASRAMIVSEERKLSAQVEQYQHLVQMRDDREKQVWSLQRKVVREERLATFRSELGKQFFPQRRKQTLTRAFTCWVQQTQARSSTEKLFQLHMAIEAHQSSLKRQYKTIAEASDPAVQQDDRDRDRVKPSRMQKHMSRKLRCRNCNSFFTETINHSQVCAYHAGVFETACPRTCERASQSQSGSVDTKCMAHYRRRWSCCDETKPSPFGKGGCQRRWHIPEDVDPIYAEMFKREEDSRLARQRLQVDMDAKTDRWVTKFRVAGYKRLSMIQQGLDSKRSIVKEFDKMKFV